MSEPDWDKINKEKQMNIILGRSQNQALDLIIALKPVSKDIEEAYKNAAKKFFEWNCDLQKELLEFSVPSLDQKPKLSDKQKLCPQCSKPMPKSWKRHDACGWKE